MERIELEHALELLKSVQKKQDQTEVVPLHLALNRILASPIIAPINVPSFNKAAMDGYALKSQDIEKASKTSPVMLTVVDEVYAGHASNTVDAHDMTAIRIMTGGKIPDAYDCVVRQEDTDYGEDCVLIYASSRKYMNYSKIGEDILQGDVILEAYTSLSAIHLGVVASLGIHEVSVLKRPRIGFLTTGTELAMPGEVLKVGQIYDSNQAVLTARLHELGFEIITQTMMTDDAQDVATFIKKHAHEVDLFLTTGGVSVGKKDIMHDVLAHLDATRLFWRLNLRPGTPVLAATYEKKLILSLSGNPFAALTTFELLMRPLLSHMLQTPIFKLVKKEATLLNRFSKGSTQRRFVRAYYEDGEVKLLSQKHASSVLSSMIGCNCFIDILANSNPIESNEKVTVWLI